MRQVSYKNEIYPYGIRVIIGADLEYIKKTFVDLENEDVGWDEWKENYGGRTMFVRNKSNKRKEILFLFHSVSDMDVDIIGHECLHAISMYCKYLGITYSFEPGEDEPIAYLMGWLVRKVCEAYHKFKKEEEEGKDGKEE